MMKLALLASTLSAAAAFAPASQQSARVATVVEAVPEYWDADYSKEPGVTAPVSFSFKCCNTNNNIIILDSLFWI